MVVSVVDGGRGGRWKPACRRRHTSEMDESCDLFILAPLALLPGDKNPEMEKSSTNGVINSHPTHRFPTLILGSATKAVLARIHGPKTPPHSCSRREEKPYNFTRDYIVLMCKCTDDSDQ